MIAAKQQFWDDAVPSVENPYYEENLIAQWDGIWNAGLGVHNDNATTWKDLAGSYDVYTNAADCNGTFTANGLMCHGDKLAAKGDLDNILPFNVNAEIEVVLTFPDAVTTSSNFSMFYFHGGGLGSNEPSASNASRNVLWIDTRAQYSRFGTAFIGGGYALYRFGNSIPAGVHSIRYPKCAYPGHYGSIVENRPWVDNAQMAKNVAAQGGTAWNGGGNRITFGGAQAADDSILHLAFDGFVINAIRWYSSVLTPEQRQKHYAADVARFGVPSAA